MFVPFHQIRAISHQWFYNYFVSTDSVLLVGLHSLTRRIGSGCGGQPWSIPCFTPFPAPQFHPPHLYPSTLKEFTSVTIRPAGSVLDPPDSGLAGVVNPYHQQEKYLQHFCNTSAGGKGLGMGLNCIYETVSRHIWKSIHYRCSNWRPSIDRCSLWSVRYVWKCP